MTDDDSKGHIFIVQEAVVSDNEVMKLGCVAHVLHSCLHSLQKRLGQTYLDDGKPIGGAGSITNNTIGKHQVYYERAIRDNTHNIQDMENAAMAGITPSQPMTILIITFVQIELLSEGSRHWNI